jgi:hypothetical protein
VDFSTPGCARLMWCEDFFFFELIQITCDQQIFGFERKKWCRKMFSAIFTNKD